MKRKLVSTLQIAQTECGLCCVRTILDYFGYQASIVELRKKEEPGRDGLNFKQIKDLLAEFNIESNIYKVRNINALGIIDYPIIAFWKEHHFICVERVLKNDVIIMDPSVGRIKISLREFLENFSNFILVPKKGKSFQKRRRSLANKWSKDYLWPSKIGVQYLKIALISIFLVGITFLLPISTQVLIDTGVTTTNSFHTILISLFLTTIVYILFSYIKNELTIKTIYSFNWNIMNKAFTKLLSLPLKYFTVRAPGEISYRLSSLTQIQNILGVDLVQSFLNLISSLCLLVYIFNVSIVLGSIISFLLILTIVFLSSTHPYLDTAIDKELHEGSLTQSVQLDAIVSVNNVKLGGYAKAYLDDWKNNLKNMLGATTHKERIQNGLIGSVLSGIQLFGPLFVLILSLRMVDFRMISLGQALAVQTITSLIFSYSNTVFNTVMKLSMATQYIELAEDIFQYSSEKLNLNSKVRTPNYGNLKIRKLNFKYSGNTENVIQDINFDISAGETLAIVGVSGAGKSTLGKIIGSLFTPTSGKIFFDNKEYSKYNLQKLRSVIGYIPQEAHLHNRTILQNLELSSAYKTDEIITFCRELGFLEFIDELPMGYQTMVSEMGGNLSGGQRQRIQIAKALLQKPKLLIMDEATSALDNISQKLVYDALDSLACSKVVIAHRFETVLNADKILVLSHQGKQVQFGTHYELITHDGPYQKLFRTKLAMQ